MKIINARLRRQEALFTLDLQDGMIHRITAQAAMQTADAGDIDARGRLAIPPFVEPHIHLDATLTAGEPEWNRSGTLFEGITRWSQRKASITPEDTRQRAMKTIGMLRDFGVQHVRTHVDVTDPSLAIVADGEPVIGVVYDPNHRELCHALRGHGAWLNDAPIRPHPATTVKEGVMGVGTSHRVTPADFLPFLQALLSDGGMFIRNGSGALMSAWAAAGRLIGYYEPHMNPWDALPGLVLMREAGGASNDFLAQEGIQRGNPLLLASQTLYPQLKKMIPQPLH